MTKIVKKCLKKVSKLENTKKGITKIIQLKLDDLENLKLLNPAISGYKDWVVYKIYGTSYFGAYRIIVAENRVENKLICDFYFKSERSDLDKQEYSEIKNLLKQCEDEEFFNSLDDF